MGNLGRKLIKALKEANLVKDEKKSLWQRIKLAIYLSDYLDPLFNLYTHCISIPYERITRIWAYTKYLWRQGEWDWEYHLGLWALSLERLHKIMENGCHVNYRNRTRRMKTAIHLMKRMSNTWDSYVQPHYNYMDKTFGDMPSIIDKEWKDRSKRYKNKQHEKFYKEFILDGEDKKFKEDMELLFKILRKDLRSWWD